MAESDYVLKLLTGATFNEDAPIGRLFNQNILLAKGTSLADAEALHAHILKELEQRRVVPSASSVSPATTRSGFHGKHTEIGPSIDIKIMVEQKAVADRYFEELYSKISNAAAKAPLPRGARTPSP